VALQLLRKERKISRNGVLDGNDVYANIDAEETTLMHVK
jgi:hypothetical protein